MSKNNKIIIGIISTLCLVIIIGITYAAFTGQLQINGTANVRDSKWDIHIVEEGQLEPSNITGSAKVLTKPLASTTSISDFNLSLTTPGDYIEYTFHVINDGDYDAEISTLTKNGVTCTANGSTSDPEAVKVCNKLEYTLKYDNGSNVSEGDTLLSKQTQTMILKIKYQEFNDPSLLPKADVAISGLGISLTYTQDGNAKVNNDGTTPYNAYPVGRQITVANETYHIISVPSNEDYVVALKDNPLTATEITSAGGTLGHTYSDTNQTGGMVYGSDSTYTTSNVKSVVNAWAQAKFTDELKTVDGYSARLINTTELEGLGYVYDGTYYPVNGNVPSWVYNNNYWYWTMSPSYSDVWGVSYDGSLNRCGVFSNGGAVRPVINVYKSSL